MARRHLDSSGTRITLLVGLLVAICLFALMLAYEAHQATRTERVTVERVLRDYASVAAWELRSAARERLEGALARAFGPVITDAASSPYEVLPPLRAFRAAAEREFACASPADAPARIHFRLDFRDGSFLSEPSTIPAGTRAVLEGAARRFGRGAATPERPAGVVPGRLQDATPPVALGVRYARLGAPVAVYGARLCPSALGASFFRAILARHPLVPAAQAVGRSNDSLFSITILGARDDTILAAPPEALTSFVSEVVLPEWGGARARVAIRSGAAAELLVGGRERSRVPVLIGLLIASAALGVIALLHIRREHELAQLRADFTSSVSHELRTPLAQILLFGETLSLGRARSDAERRLAAETIVQEARRLVHMVDNVLLFARGRRARADLSPAPTGLAAVGEAVVAGFTPLAMAAGTRLIVDLGRAPHVLADAGALRQILLNLLDNAVKYGRAGQTVRVSWGADSERVRLVVDDEGSGIAPPDRERIWSPYVRLRRDQRGIRGGSGIGLAVVRELAESLGGRTWVEGAPGGGARFVVEFARVREATVAGPPPDHNMRPDSHISRHPSAADRSIPTPGAHARTPAP